MAGHGLSGVVGLVAFQDAESSWARDQTCIPCIGRQILSHLTTREIPRLDLEHRQIYIHTHLSLEDVLPVEIWLVKPSSRRSRALCPEAFTMEMFSMDTLTRTAWLSHSGLFTFLIFLSGAKVNEGGSDASGYLSHKEDRESATVSFDEGALLIGRS